MEHDSIKNAKMSSSNNKLLQRWTQVLTNFTFLSEVLKTDFAIKWSKYPSFLFMIQSNDLGQKKEKNLILFFKIIYFQIYIVFSSSCYRQYWIWDKEMVKKVSYLICQDTEWNSNQHITWSLILWEKSK